ncbi:hypothetical protein HHI36_006804 [Cryptolaemus montrouzieri]|uniref:Uncharacterized protein n=1 Tax=Cryptolaemus montrouzieri TaxID=559131 RepID=A0ABD2NY85_9CUCU
MIYLFDLSIVTIDFLSVHNRESLFQLFSYIRSVCASINLWMKAAVSFERFIEIRFSAQGQNVINIKKTRIIIIAIVTFTVLWKICVFWKVCITLIN